MIPDLWVAEIGIITVRGQPRQKDPLSTNGWAQWCVPVIPAMQGSKNRRITGQASLGTEGDPNLKK
jgi:hypothetical protein